MSTRAPQLVYGPVPSRRLGRSLGIDLVPFKTCSYDCIYCQLGRTTVQTTALASGISLAGVLDELAEQLARVPRPTTSGLPARGAHLHPELGRLIDDIKRLTAVPVAVLTNGSLLWRPQVRAALTAADLVLPSLDAGDAATFQRVNRPHPDIAFAQMVEGLVDFAAAYRGEIWLEVFVLRGITDDTAAIAKIAAIAARIHPARVQLNTATRPTAEPGARRAAAATLARLCVHFTGRCEVIAETHRAARGLAASDDDPEAAILALLARRPCTVAGIAAGLALRPNAVLKALATLCARGELRLARKAGAVYYERVGNR